MLRIELYNRFTARQTTCPPTPVRPYREEIRFPDMSRSLECDRLHVREHDQNPQKHGFVNDFRSWKYSSYGVILNAKPASINRQEALKWFATREDDLSLHDQWVTDAQAKRFAESDLDG